MSTQCLTEVVNTKCQHPPLYPGTLKWAWGKAILQRFPTNSAQRCSPKQLLHWGDGCVCISAHASELHFKLLLQLSMWLRLPCWTAQSRETFLTVFLGIWIWGRKVSLTTHKTHNSGKIASVSLEGFSLLFTTFDSAALMTYFLSRVTAPSQLSSPSGITY